MNSKHLTGKVRKAGGKATDKKPLMRKSKPEGLTKFDDSTKSLLLEIGDLKIWPDETEKILRSIRSGQMDSIVVSTAEGELVYTLKDTDYPYMTIAENINEGAVTLLPDGRIIHANKCFADMLGLALENIIGYFFHYFVHESGKKEFLRLLEDSLAGKQKGEFLLCTAWDSYLPVAVSTNPLPIEEQMSVSMVITDLTEQKKREDRLNFEVRKRTAELEVIIVELVAQNLELRSVQQQLKEDQKAP
jgi:two-component system phosphate regulon sensor histidine kinase PhoR